jgi:outer membrane lipoprotein LolB
MTRLWLRGIAIAGLLGLAACAPVRVHETPGALADQSAREAQLAARTHWSLSAHIFVSDGADNNGSGDLEWRQAGERYDFTLRAPTGKTWKLSGDDRHAVLEGVDVQPLQGRDAEQLLHERLGWEVPIADLSSWVRGLRRPEQHAALQFDELNRPATLDQDGWTIEYRDWFADMNPPLPRKVFASRGAARVKMAIERWSFD